MRYLVWLILVAIGIGPPAHATIAPRHGGPLPKSYFEVKSRDPGAFQSTRGWIQKAEQIKIRRDSYAGLVTTLAETRYQVAGDFAFPVLLGEFVNQPATFEPDSLDKELFSGPWPTGTLDDYFREVSYGALSISGVVADWVTTFQQDFYYEGVSNGLVPNDARTGEFMKELLDANDSLIDFGLFDNDGPDGVPNSGDDDGYVDFVVFVHSEAGAECDDLSPNILSHSWVYRGWPNSGGAPYTTNDASANGGNILVDDYSIQSGRSCDTGIIEIGGFAHHIGHSLGLPDLFDFDGGSSGVGHWDLMGSGNWNTPATPAHLSAWSKKELGWVSPTVVTWDGNTQSIPQIETNPVCFELPFADSRFQRAGDCAIAGSFSLRCGLGLAESTARGWGGGTGYGNGWAESLEHPFVFDGNAPVTFSFDFSHELEPLADSAMVYITVEGVRSLLAAYTGNGSGSQLIDISPYLAAATAPFEYALEFFVKSDEAWSDEDGKYLTTCGALVVDNIAVTGGGVAYTGDFESAVDGWYQNPAKNPASEYWLVENRQGVGFDAQLHNPGLLIWHVDESILRSAQGNSGGSTNTAARGLVLEEADGAWHLLEDPETTGNAGDPGDPFPGSASNTVFNSGSTPNSNGNSGYSTRIEVSAVGPPSETMTAYLRAGDPGPVLSVLSPDVLNNDLTSVEIQIKGDNISPGATAWLTKPGEDDFGATRVDWRDTQTLFGDFYVYSKSGGAWDLHVMNADGQEAALIGAVTIVQIVATQLVAAMVEVRAGAVQLEFELRSTAEGERVVVTRSLSSSGPWTPLAIEPAEYSVDMYRIVDESVESGRTYFYRLEVWTSGEKRELYRTSVRVPSGVFALEQNVPNPFNPATTISFSLPTATKVTLEVYDVSGRLVRTLSSKHLPPGRHESVWDGADAAGNRVGSGIYFYRLTGGKDAQTRKMILLK